jgi:hypothetical protein
MSCWGGGGWHDEKGGGGQRTWAVEQADTQQSTNNGSGGKQQLCDWAADRTTRGGYRGHDVGRWGGSGWHDRKGGGWSNDSLSSSYCATPLEMIRTMGNEDDVMRNRMRTGGLSGA